MIKLYLYSFFIFLVITFPLNATNIAVVNIDNLITTNNEYNFIINEIEKNQKSHHSVFINQEKLLDQKLAKIEKSKLLLNENEIKNMIDKYNEDLEKFTIMVDDFNLHYQNQIVNIRKIILDEIILLIEKYANDNQI